MLPAIAAILENLASSGLVLGGMRVSDLLHSVNAEFEAACEGALLDAAKAVLPDASADAAAWCANAFAFAMADASTGASLARSGRSSGQRPQEQFADRLLAALPGQFLDDMRRSDESVDAAAFVAAFGECLWLRLRESAESDASRVANLVSRREHDVLLARLDGLRELAAAEVSSSGGHAWSPAVARADWTADGPFELLTGGVRRSLPALEHFLALHLGIPEGNGTPFGGRDRELSQIDEWLFSSDQPFLLVVSDGGRGKSALLANWAMRTARADRASVALLPLNLRLNLREDAVQLLAERVSYLVKDANELVSTATTVDALQRLLRVKQDPQHPLVLVIDGIDEAAGWAPERDIPLPPLPPSGVKVIVSARKLVNRDAVGWARALRWSEPTRITLEVFARPAIADILTQNPGLAPGVVQPWLIDEIHRITAGDPLMVSMYVSAVSAEGFLTPERLGGLQIGGINDYFEEWWTAQEVQWAAEGKDTAAATRSVRWLLRAMASALGPLDFEDIVELATIHDVSFSPDELRDALKWLRRWLVPDQHVSEGYVFTHPRLAEYFRAEMLERERLSMQRCFLELGRSALECWQTGTARPRTSSYAVRYYGAHLEAGLEPGLRELSGLVTPAWASAWESVDSGRGGFLRDVDRVWSVADRVVQELGAEDDIRMDGLAAQLRCALITSSIHSLAGSVDPVLLSALVQRNSDRWTAAWALGQAQQIDDPERRCEALRVLAPVLPGNLVLPAAAIARTIHADDKRATALVAIAGPAPAEIRFELLDEAFRASYDVAGGWGGMKALIAAAGDALPDLYAILLDQTCLVADQRSRTQALEVLVPHTPPDMIGPTLAAICESADGHDRARLLSSLAANVPAEFAAQLLPAASEIDDEHARARALAALVLRLPAEYANYVFDAATGIADEQRRALVLSALAKNVPAGLVGALRAAASEISDDRYRGNVLRTLGAHMPTEMTEEALSVADTLGRDWRRAAVLAAIGGRIAGEAAIPIFADALAHAREVKDVWSRMLALTEVLRHLPPSDAPDVLSEVLANTRAIADPQRKIRSLYYLATLRWLADEIRTEILREALHETSLVGDEWLRGQMLHLMIVQLPSELTDTAFAVAQTLDEYPRHTALDALAPRLPDHLMDEAFRITIGYTQDYIVVPALEALLPWLPDRLIGEAHSFVRNLTSIRARERLMRVLIYRLQEPELAAALSAAYHVGDSRDKQRALAELASALHSSHSSRRQAPVQEDTTSVRFEEQLAQLQETIRGMPDSAVVDMVATLRGKPDDFWKAMALAAAAPRLPHPERCAAFDEAFQTACRLEDWHRGFTLGRLAPQLPVERDKDVIAAALEPRRPWTTAEEAVTVLEHLTPTRREPFTDQVLRVVMSIDSRQTRYSQLRSLIPLLPDAAIPGICDVVSGIVDEIEQGWIVQSLAPTLPVEMVEPVLELACSLTNPQAAAQALSALAPLLSGPLTAVAMDAAGEIDDRRWRAEAMTALAVASSTAQRDGDLARAVDAVLGTAPGFGRADQLAKLVPLLPAGLLGDALDGLMQIDTGPRYDRQGDRMLAGPAEAVATALNALADRAATLTDSERVTLWTRALREAAKGRRSRLLKTVPTLARLLPDGTALDKLTAEIEDVCEWWT